MLKLFTIVICIAAPIFASDDVLAPGPPPLTRDAVHQIASFLEFALESRLTPEEQAAFEREQVSSWRKSTPKQREETLQIARMNPTIQTMGPEQREEVRGKVQPQLLETLRRSPEDPVSKLLLGIYQRGQVSSSAPIPAAGRVPQQLVGEWSTVSTSNIGYVNQTTGSWAPPSGDGSYYKIYPDGRFEFTGLMQSSMYNCTMTISGHETGILRFDGQQIVFDSAGGTLTSKDNCNSRFNYQKPVAPNVKTYSWKLTQDQWGPQFCIWAPGVKENCARKK
jgi:hypothetical protein